MKFIVKAFECPHGRRRSNVNNQSKGSKGEELAVDFLKKKGYRILTRNFRFQHGEIDIIAEDGYVLVFVEVKTRKSMEYGSPEESISVRKRKLLRRTAEGYMYTKKIEDRECRCDVIAIEYQNNVCEIRHLVDAF